MSETFRFNDRRPSRVIGPDPHGIIPRGVSHGAVIPLDLQVRLTTEYDTAYLQDRVVAEVFINRQPTRCRAVAVVDERQFGYDPDSLLRAVEHYGPDLQRMVVEELIGTNLRAEVSRLGSVVREQDHRADKHGERIHSLESEIIALRRRVFRPPWYKRAALKIATWWV